MQPLSPLSQEAQSIHNKKYRHYKGGEYVVLCVGRMEAEHTQEVVVYQSVDQGYVWVRPVESFLESVATPDYSGPRFVLRNP